MVNSNRALSSGVVIGNSPRSQEAKKPSSPLVTSRSLAQSVTREARSGPVWPWWDEVNPIDGEVCAQPWTNNGLIDLEHDGDVRDTGSGERHRCSRCDLTWRGDPECWSCGHVADDDWTGRAFSQSDGMRRHPGGMR